MSIDWESYQKLDVRYIDLAPADQLTDLPPAVTRLPREGTLDICPPDRVAEWIKVHHASGELTSVENSLGFVAMYTKVCDTPIKDEKFGTVLGLRDFLFMVERPEVD